MYQETDKATIDVEAQDDGVMGKILVSTCSPLSLRELAIIPMFLACDMELNVIGQSRLLQDPRRTSNSRPSRRRRRLVFP